jgi:hypothetical protein
VYLRESDANVLIYTAKDVIPHNTNWIDNLTKAILEKVFDALGGGQESYSFDYKILFNGIG